MQLAYVWYNPVERVTIEKLISADEPEWRVQCVPESDLADIESLVHLLKSGHDAIMLHLSKPPCVALKLAELRHHDKLKTRILVLSKTDADPDALAKLFCGHLNPDRDIVKLTEKVKAIIEMPQAYLDIAEIEEAIVKILNTDSVFQYQFRVKFPVLYREPFAIADYRAFAQTHLNKDGGDPQRRSRKRVFISYAEKDERDAMILRQFLTERNVKTFLAARDIEGGDQWESEISEAIRTCAEMLVLVTPNSVGSAWVNTEVGAAWALGKRITPCIRGMLPNDVPSVLARTQARVFDHKYGDKELADEVARRIHHT